MHRPSVASSGHSGEFPFSKGESAYISFLSPLREGLGEGDEGGVSVGDGNGSPLPQPSPCLPPGRPSRERGSSAHGIVTRWIIPQAEALHGEVDLLMSDLKSEVRPWNGTTRSAKSWRKHTRGCSARGIVTQLVIPRAKDGKQRNQGESLVQVPGAPGH
jgi:hypothetical protein